YDRPLLLMAALRAEALRAGARHPLHAALALPEVSLEAATRPALASALADAPPRLFGERLSLQWTDLAGAPVPTATSARIVGRHGFDAHPLEVSREDDLNWLRACIWPGETARLGRLERAVAAFLAPRAAASPEPRLEVADLAAVPARLGELARAQAPEALLLAYQTVVRDYLPDAVRAAYVEGMTRWVASAPAAGPARLWIELEAVADAWKNPDDLPMAIEAHAADGAGGSRTFRLARCSYHPDRIDPDPAVAAAFVDRKI